jgi:glycine cleavage system H lipoate-binding protein
LAFEFGTETGLNDGAARPHARADGFIDERSIVCLPVSGTVVDVNEALVDEPGLLNSDAFENWIVRVEMDDPGELNRLMDATDYEKFCSKR